MQKKNSQHRSPENLYLLASLLLFVILPFQNCSLSPVDTAWADGEHSYKVELRNPKAAVEGELSVKRDIAAQSHSKYSDRSK